MMAPLRGNARKIGGAGQAGFTLLELSMAMTLVVVVVLMVGKNFLDSSRAFTGLAKLLYGNTRAQLLMDRLVQELLPGSFTSLVPDVPVDSSSIEFQKVVGVVNGEPVLGNTIHIELVPLETNSTDGLDNDGDSLVDECGIRIWEDLAPFGPTPSPPDAPVLICGNLAAGGLKINREGSLLVIDLTLQEVVQPGEPPRLIHLVSGVKLRND
jgi:prepilin-type N-terminal cleavage/methylation domain-containing protein